MASLTSLIETHALQHPNRVALHGLQQSSMTFGQLHALICETRAALGAWGIGAGDVLAMVTPNGPVNAAAFLALAGVAACAPLNPQYRAADYEFYLDDLNARALVVAAEFETPAREVARARGIPVIEMRTIAHGAAGTFALELNDVSDGPPPPPDPDFRDVGLILHTSGTTSRPKMVPLTHENLCHSARNVANALQLGPNDCCLNVMPLFHIHGLVAALLASMHAGASVACSPGYAATEFFGWLDTFKPTWYTAVPTMHQGILERAARQPDAAKSANLRLIRSSSAALPPTVLAALEDTFACPVIEAYGMTEAAHQMASNPLPPAAHKPGSVGLLAGPEIAILDAEGNELPPGERGEIAIRGPNVTKGYAANPEANATAFTHGWFRTGDEGMFDPDGYLFLTGRLKEMINRGGEKISPREIDEALLAHPAVAQALAFAVPDTKLGEEIAAVVVKRPGTEITEAQLQEFALLKLAAFKLPRRIVFLDEIPKGPTGKPQRIGLAERLGIDAISTPQAPANGELHPPIGEVEETIAAIWKEVLACENVWREDNFFDSGGDSILAGRLIARLSDALSVTITFVDLYQAPVLAQLADRIAEARKKGTETPEAIPLVPRGESHDLSPAQKRFWMMQQLEPDNVALHRPLLIRIEGPLNTRAIRMALRGLVQRHEILRARYTAHDSEPAQFIDDIQQIPFDLRDTTTAEDPLAEVQRQAAEASHQPFDLENGPLFIPILFRMGTEQHLLLLHLHHIVFDGWSSHVLVRDLAALYEAEITKSPSPLPNITTQFLDFAAWKNTQKDTTPEQTGLNFWRQYLSNAPAYLPLTERTPDATAWRGSSHVEKLDTALVAKLQQVARTNNATLFMVLLAALNATLHRILGVTDTVVGTLTSGRTRREFEDLVGPFINTIALRVQIDPKQSHTELIARVRESCIEALRHEDIPFERVVEELRPPRVAFRHPFFNVLFQLRNFPTGKANAGETLFIEEPFDTGVTRADLDIAATPHADGLLIEFRYPTNFVSNERIEGLATEMRHVLEFFTQEISVPAKETAPL